MKTKKEVEQKASELYGNKAYGMYSSNGFVKGYEEARTDAEKLEKEITKYKTAYGLLSEYFDSISDEERPKIHNKLVELGL
jgi:hypothetical protein